MSANDENLNWDWIDEISASFKNDTATGSAYSKLEEYLVFMLKTKVCFGFRCSHRALGRNSQKPKLRDFQKGYLQAF